MQPVQVGTGQSPPAALVGFLSLERQLELSAIDSLRRIERDIGDNVHILALETNRIILYMRSCACDTRERSACSSCPGPLWVVAICTTERLFPADRCRTVEGGAASERESRSENSPSLRVRGVQNSIDCCCFFCLQTSSLLDTYSAALEVIGDTPGIATSVVRAYASLLADGRDDSSPPFSAEETEVFQVNEPSPHHLCCFLTLLLSAQQ